MASIKPRRRASDRGSTMSEFEKQVNTLLRSAMEQPGVAEAMRIYENQQPVMQAFEQAQSLTQPKVAFSTSSSTLFQS